MKNEHGQDFSLDDLCALADTPKRTARFYIQKGLIPRPEGAGRGAVYSRHHLEALLTIRKWKEAGLSLERIGQLLAGAETEAPPAPRPPGSVEVWSHVVIGRGLELHIDPEQAGLTPEQTRRLIIRILDSYNTLGKGGKGR